jgi:chromosome segregation protein
MSPEGRPAHPGVIALAEQVVECDNQDLADLPRRLLGRTLIVRDLATARAIAAHTVGYRFVTLQGELLEADGTLTIGTHHAETGILSRKSELRELREQVSALDGRLADINLDRAELARRVAESDAEAKDLSQEIGVLTGQAADLHLRLEHHLKDRDEKYQEVALSNSEMDRLEEEIQALEAKWRQAREEAAAAEIRVAELQQRKVEAEREIRQREQYHAVRQQECTTARVALERVEGRRRDLRRQLDRLEADLAERRREWQQAEDHLERLQQQLRESTARRLHASSSLAQGYADKETAERALIGLREEHGRQQRQQEELSKQAEIHRQSWSARQEEVHARDLEVNNLRNRLDSLVARLHEDYQVSFRLAAEAGETGEAGQDGRPEAVAADGSVLAFVPIADSRKPEAEEEMAELKRKLNRLGNVNLDAIQELQEKELQASTLQAQFDDLTAAKRSLEDIIGRINVDSRRLFTDTLTTVRGHFQELFRKLFGGGQADIVLEDEADVLESGIEIVARPPGKELRSISLMSGGEKTLTAVALLLAIFRSKPSPFCILDEVDAALDEANVGRLVSVLREFLDRSQFILITHSKRTMASADVLYGITMQESGISKRVAVRFEDWPDEERNPQRASDQDVA